MPACLSKPSLAYIYLLSCERVQEREIQRGEEAEGRGEGVEKWVGHIIHLSVRDRTYTPILYGRTPAATTRSYRYFCTVL